jgi:hypothetical protein
MTTSADTRSVAAVRSTFEGREWRDLALSERTMRTTWHFIGITVRVAVRRSDKGSDTVTIQCLTRYGGVIQMSLPLSRSHRLVPAGID